jgi:hypothetical protein
VRGVVSGFQVLGTSAATVHGAVRHLHTGQQAQLVLLPAAMTAIICEGYTYGGAYTSYTYGGAAMVVACR